MTFFKRKLFATAIVTAVISTIFTGCGEDQQKAAQAPKVQVKVMKVVQRDTPLASEYPGQLVGTEEVKVQSKVSGSVVDKFVVGGQFVEAGQLLYKIDARQLETSILQAQADLAQTEANLHNAEIDLQRYQMLLKENAIAEQTVTTQESTVRSYQAALGVKQAAIRLAQQNLSDTNIYAPMSGQLGVDDVAVGTFITAGQTSLVSIGSINPIFAQFTISENEYLKFMTVQAMQSSHNPMTATITLADGKEYPFEGRVVETDRQLANNTGSLVLKAVFPNQSGLLMPGMFARVKLEGETIPNAILVPQRAVQQLLGKSFVMIVDENGKAKAQSVELAQQIGSYYIVTSGLKASDRIVVEGLTSLQEGMDLAITEVTPGEMGFTLTNVTTPYSSETVNNATVGHANAPGNVNRQ